MKSYTDSEITTILAYKNLKPCGDREQDAKLADLLMNIALSARNNTMGWQEALKLGATWVEEHEIERHFSKAGNEVLTAAMPDGAVRTGQRGHLETAAAKMIQG